MIVDAHSTVFPEGHLAEVLSKANPGLTELIDRATAAEVLADGTRAGVDVSVSWLLGTTNETCRLGNDFIAELSTKHSRRFVPVATVNPHDPDEALRELDRCIGELGFAGLKIHPLVQQIRINDPRVLRIVARAAEYGIPIVFHVDPELGENYDYSQWPAAKTELAPPELLADVLDVYNSEKIIAAHLGGVRHPEVASSQCSFQTTGPPAHVIHEAVQEVGARRVMFGSDFPFFGIKDEVDKIIHGAIQAEDRDLILAGNAKRIFGEKFFERSV